MSTTIRGWKHGPQRRFSFSAFFITLMAVYLSLTQSVNAKTNRLRSSKCGTVNSCALAKYHHYQDDLPLCAVFAEQGVLEAYTNQPLPEGGVFYWYLQAGVFDVENHGVPPERLGEALRVKHIPSALSNLSMSTLSQYLDRGYAVLAIVSSRPAMK